MTYRSLLAQCPIGFLRPFNRGWGNKCVGPPPGLSHPALGAYPPWRCVATGLANPGHHVLYNALAAPGPPRSQHTEDSVPRPGAPSQVGTGPRTTGTRGLRRCGLPTRPVLYHRLKSLTGAMCVCDAI